MTIAIIPARGGSKRIPRKNIVDFLGQPMITYPLRAAILSDAFDRIWVSTDDAEIGAVAGLYGADMILRPPELADDYTGTQAVVKHALTAIHNAVDIACCLYATAPLLKPDTLSDALAVLRGTDSDYVVPCATWLRDPGQFYMGRADAFLQDRPLLGDRTALLRVDPETECDINTEEDWMRAERMYDALKRGGA